MPRTIQRDEVDRDGIDRDGLLAKLAKYIPAEINAAFIFGSGIVESMSLADWAYWSFFLFCVVFAPIYFFLAALVEKRKPDKAQVAISPFAVVVWVLAIGGPFTLVGGYNKGYGLLLLGPFTLIVPFVDWAITESQKRKKRSQ